METQTAVRDIVLDVVRNSDMTDWVEITDAVLQRLDPAEYADALRQVLPKYVQVIVTSRRQSGPVAAPTEVTAAPPVDALPIQTPTRRHVSAKFAAINDDWQLRLREIYPGADGIKKHLADFGYQDLTVLADRLRRTARSTMARATGFQQLAEALQQHNASTVADLPTSVAQRLVAAA